MCELGRRAKVGEMQVTEARQPVIDCYDDDVGEPRKPASVVLRTVAGASGKSAAME